MNDINPKPFDKDQFEEWKQKQQEAANSSTENKPGLLTYLLEIPAWIVTLLVVGQWGRGSGKGELLDSAGDFAEPLHWRSLFLLFIILVAAFSLYYYFR